MEITNVFSPNNFGLITLLYYFWPREKNNNHYKAHKEAFHNGRLLIVLYVTRYSEAPGTTGAFLLYHLKKRKERHNRINWLLKKQL
jgi:hypothetical protein